jgi:dephospho-CoA kinase
MIVKNTATKPLVIGLTGGIGSGKTAATDAFAALGIAIIDADIIARDVVAPGAPALALISEHFGADFIQADGALDRSKLRQRVFANENDKQWLNACLHPKIRQAMQQAIAKVSSPYCILAVPLLIENKMQSMVDKIVVVDCPESMQLSRALARDGSDPDTIKSIMASQASRQERLSQADHVLDNSQSLAFLHAQVKQLHDNFLALSQAE